MGNLRKLVVGTVSVSFVGLIALSASAVGLPGPAFRLPFAPFAPIARPAAAPPAPAALTFGLLSDAGMGNLWQETVRQALVRQHVPYVLMAGDNLYPRSGDEDDREDYVRVDNDRGRGKELPSFDEIWGSWMRAGLRFPVVALGNHPGRKHYAEEVKYFGLPNEAYSRVMGPARFIVLNSDNEEGVPGQMQWFERELAAAKEPLIFVVYHHPTYFSGKHDPDQKAEFQAAMRPLLARYRAKLAALIVGHDHMTALLGYNDLPVIFAAGAGEGKRAEPVDYVDHGVHVRTAWTNSDIGAPYWARLDIDPARNEATVRYQRATDDRVACTLVVRGGQAARLSPDCH